MGHALCMQCNKLHLIQKSQDYYFSTMLFENLMPSMYYKLYVQISCENAQWGHLFYINRDCMNFKKLFQNLHHCPKTREAILTPNVYIHCEDVKRVWKVWILKWKRLLSNSFWNPWTFCPPFVSIYYRGEEISCMKYQLGKFIMNKYFSRLFM